MPPPPAHHGGDREPSRSRSVRPSATSRDVRFRPLALVLFASLLGLALVLLVPRPAQAFGDTGAFDPRVLLTGNQTGPARATAPARWSWELVQRTSAPARLRPTLVRADDPAIVDAPFLYWSGDTEVAPLTSAELSGLRRFFALGGVLLVDDAAPGPAGEQSAFARSARHEIARGFAGQRSQSRSASTTSSSAPSICSAVPRAGWRGRTSLDAIVRGGQAQVIFSEHDLGGALARGASGCGSSRSPPAGTCSASGPSASP